MFESKQLFIPVIRSTILFLCLLAPVVSFAQKYLNSLVFTTYEFEGIMMPLTLVEADSFVLSYDASTASLDEFLTKWILYPGDADERLTSIKKNL